jgi:hypothetical protein
MFLIDDEDLNGHNDDQMERISLQKFLHHECNVDEQVKHDQHHHNPKKIF